MGLLGDPVRRESSVARTSVASIASYAGRSRAAVSAVRSIRPRWWSFGGPVAATLFFLCSCGAAASQSVRISPNQKVLAELRGTISAAGTLVFKFPEYGSCSTAIYRAHGTAVVGFAEALDLTPGGEEGGKLELPPMLTIEIYRGEQLLDSIEMIEHMLVRHPKLDSDMTYSSGAVYQKMLLWFTTQSIPILKCIEFPEE